MVITSTSFSFKVSYSSNNIRCDNDLIKHLDCSQNALSRTPSVVILSGKDENDGKVTVTATPPSTPNQQKTNNAKRRKTEDKMAMIFIAIVTGFLVTNFPRIFLNFHEVLVIDHVKACSAAGFG